MEPGPTSQLAAPEQLCSLSDPTSGVLVAVLEVGEVGGGEDQESPGSFVSLRGPERGSLKLPSGAYPKVRGARVEERPRKGKTGM